MRVVTDQEMLEFLAKHDDLRYEEHRLHFEHPEASSIRVELRVAEPHQLIHLARLAAHLSYEEAHFRSASLWITAWGIWNGHDEAVAIKVIERFRQGYGEYRSLNAAPGHFFRHDEFVESVSCLLQPMLVGWDAYYVPQWDWGTLDYFLFVSHDSYVDVVTRTTWMYERALEVLRSRQWIVIDKNKPKA